MVEAVDAFLIAIAVYIISIGLYSLFIDDKLPLPKWLEVHNLEDLKGNLVSVVIAVLAVLFLREVGGLGRPQRNRRLRCRHGLRDCSADFLPHEEQFPAVTRSRRRAAIHAFASA